MEVLDREFGGSQDSGFRLDVAPPLSADQRLVAAHRRYQAARINLVAAKEELVAAQQHLLKEVLAWRGDRTYSDFKRAASDLIGCSERHAEQYLRAARGAESLGYFNDSKVMASLSSLAAFNAVADDPAQQDLADYLRDMVKQGDVLPSADGIRRMAQPPRPGDVSYPLSHLGDFGVHGVEAIVNLLLVAARDRAPQGDERRQRVLGDKGAEDVDPRARAALKALFGVLLTGGNVDIRMPGTMSLQVRQNRDMAARCAAALGIEMPALPKPVAVELEEWEGAGEGQGSSVSHDDESLKF
jgi:hypothetical protein